MSYNLLTEFDVFKRMPKVFAQVFRIRFSGYLVILFSLALLLAACAQTSAQKASTTSTTSTTRVAAQSTSFSGAGCAHAVYDVGNGYQIVESMNGAVSACLRVGALSQGNYHVSLYDIPLKSAIIGNKTGITTTFLASTSDKAKLSLSPSSGGPGTVVQITGTFASPLSRELKHANLCWDGCRNGLSYDGVSLKWLSKTEFQTHMTVPAAPWFNGSKMQLLKSGNYSIGIQCLSHVRGCGLTGSQGSADFTLKTAGSRLFWCKSSTGCAELSASPSVSYPGDVVKITGHVPIVSVIGTHSPQLFELKVIKGAPSGPQVVEKSISNAKESTFGIYLGHAALNVRAPKSFASLGRVTPKFVTNSGLAQISLNPLDHGQVAWCSGNTMELSDSSGSTTSISTTTVNRTVSELGFIPFPNSQPNCTSIAVVGRSGTVPTIFASFVSQPSKQNPPFADVALQTTNLGKTWSHVPVPDGASIDGFGGYRIDGNTLEAIFSPIPSNGGRSVFSTPLVEATNDAGKSWDAQPLACPSYGPCVTFGPYLAGNCAGGVGVSQSVLYGLDNGKTWHKASWPSSIQTCAPAQIVAISPQKVLLLTTSSQYPLRLSSDGGKEWADVAIPNLGSNAHSLRGPGSTGFQFLPSGAILFTSQSSNGGNWMLLKSGASNWCTVSTVSAQLVIAPIAVSNGVARWVSAKVSNSGHLSHKYLNSLPLSKLRC